MLVIRLINRALIFMRLLIDQGYMNCTKKDEDNVYTIRNDNREGI